MVKIGFIVEGACEKLVVESSQFKDFLQRYGYDLQTPVINAQGGGNLLPRHLQSHLQRLQQAGVSQVYVLTDAENETVTDVRSRICNVQLKFVFISVKALEAWFLADTQTLTNYLGCEYSELYPEQTDNMPRERLSEIYTEYKRRSIPGKVIFTKHIIDNGFSIERAAEHPNCPSVRELVNHFQHSSP